MLTEFVMLMLIGSIYTCFVWNKAGKKFIRVNILQYEHMCNSLLRIFCDHKRCDQHFFERRVFERRCLWISLNISMQISDHFLDVSVKFACELAFFPPSGIYVLLNKTRQYCVRVVPINQVANFENETPSEYRLECLKSKLKFRSFAAIGKQCCVFTFYFPASVSLLSV